MTTKIHLLPGAIDYQRQIETIAQSMKWEIIDYPDTVKDSTIIFVDRDSGIQSLSQEHSKIVSTPNRILVLLKLESMVDQTIIWANNPIVISFIPQHPFAWERLFKQVDSLINQKKHPLIETWIDHELLVRYITNEKTPTMSIKNAEDGSNARIITSVGIHIRADIDARVWSFGIKDRDVFLFSRQRLPPVCPIKGIIRQIPMFPGDIVIAGTTKFIQRLMNIADPSDPTYARQIRDNLTSFTETENGTVVSIEIIA